MHIPKDRSLASWIRELERDNRLYMFYKTPEWRSLAADVIEDHHRECEDCATKGVLKRAVTVHHEYEVKLYPHLALTRYKQDADGTRREVLHPLCERCHNKRHGRFCAVEKPQINEERW